MSGGSTGKEVRESRTLLALAAFALLVGIAGCASILPLGDDDHGKSHLERAELAMARGDVEEASRLFDRALVGDRKNTRALAGSARANLAAGRGELAVDRFDAYRGAGGAWRRAEHHDQCSAITLAAEQVLDEGKRPQRARALARRLAAEECEGQPAEALLLRSGLQLADRARDAGRSEEALELYRALAQGEGNAAKVKAERARRGDDVTVRYDDPHLARAYLEASHLLLAAGQRNEALALLSRGLDELPGNRDLVHLMVTVLAEGSNVVFPRAKPPEPQVPAAPD